MTVVVDTAWLPAHEQKPCPYCSWDTCSYYCKYCFGTKTMLWTSSVNAVGWDHSYSCTKCGNRHWMVEKSDENNRSRFICLRCYVAEHEEKCGCGQWEEAVLHLAASVLEQMA